MILLDTSVVSAFMAVPPDAGVLAWLDTQDSDEIWITAITVYELRFGIERLADSRRRRALESGLRRALEVVLAGRIAPFDRSAAEVAATLTARRQRSGRPIDSQDTQIAGIALAHRARLATRNTRHFADLEVEVIDPWSATPT